MEFQSAPIKGVLGRELLPSAGRESSRLRQGEGEFTGAVCKNLVVAVLPQGKTTSPQG
jgi:hypothetical protein